MICFGHNLVILTQFNLLMLLNKKLFEESATNNTYLNADGQNLYVIDIRRTHPLRPDIFLGKSSIKEV